MQRFDECITNHHGIHTILISDLHLSPNEPVLTQAFLHFLSQINQLPNLKQLYILGDWFDAWLGDDVAETVLADWLHPIIDALQQLQQKNCQIHILHGNRDFLMGQSFCDTFGGKLISQPYFTHIQQQKICLEHGDLLCTDDKKYQRFRKIIQNPFTKKLLLTLPIKKRQQIANNLRQKSRTDNQKKSLSIMDVNVDSVKQALQNCEILIHGHTHRPNYHLLENHKQRLVLGDWRIINLSSEKSQVEAVIAMGSDLQSIDLYRFQYQLNE